MALEDSLIHSWRLDGNSNDNKGSYNGTDTSMTYVAGRKSNQAGNFSGSGYIATTSTDFPSGTGAVSWAGWIKSNADVSGNEKDFFGYGAASSTNAFILGFNQTSGTLFVSQYGAAVSTTEAHANDNTWKFIVVTASADATPNYTIYVNGSVANSGTMSTNRTAASSYIGVGFQDITNTKWTGVMQDIALWSKELSSAEVTQLYNSGDGMYFDGTNFQPYGSESSASASPSASQSASPSSSESSSPSSSGSASPSSSPSASVSSSPSASFSSSLSSSPSSSVSASPSASLSASRSASPSASSSSSKSSSLSSSVSASPSAPQYEDLYTSQGTTYTDLYREF